MDDEAIKLSAKYRCTISYLGTRKPVEPAEELKFNDEEFCQRIEDIVGLENRNRHAYFRSRDLDLSLQSVSPLNALGLQDEHKLKMH